MPEPVPQSGAMTLAIKEKLEKRKPDEVEELILDGIKSSTINGLTDEFKMLRVLSIINTGLVSLDGLPYLPSLEELELSDNKLSGGLDIIVKQCPKLNKLHLSGNRIKTFDTIKCLTTLPELRSLELFNCEITLLNDYRSTIFQLFPNLHVLDGWDNMNAEVEESGDESPGSDEEEIDSEEEVELSDSTDLEPVDKIGPSSDEDEADCVDEDDSDSEGEELDAEDSHETSASEEEQEESNTAAHVQSNNVNNENSHLSSTSKDNFDIQSSEQSQGHESTNRDDDRLNECRRKRHECDDSNDPDNFDLTNEVDSKRQRRE